ncbi:MAG: hypothetical protein ACXABF_14030 [Candidatus Thorarchaeota archaeon]|jgi:hypothetical protein
MGIPIFVDYIVCTLIGFGAGALVTWLIFRNKKQTRSIGLVIDTAMISKNVYELDMMSSQLNQIVSRLKDSSDEFTEKIFNVRDIELSLTALEDMGKDIEDLGISIELDVLEKNK